MFEVARNIITKFNVRFLSLANSNLSWIWTRHSYYHTSRLFQRRKCFYISVQSAFLSVENDVISEPITALSGVLRTNDMRCFVSLAWDEMKHWTVYYLHIKETEIFWKRRGRLKKCKRTYITDLRLLTNTFTPKIRCSCSLMPCFI